MIDLIRSEIAKALRGLTPSAIGTVAEIDLKLYQVKCRLATSGQLTNWLRLGSDYVGDGFGLVYAPNIGDEVWIEFSEWNPSSPGMVSRRLFGKDSPPSLDADQLHFRHKSGTDILLTADGSVEVLLKSNGSYRSNGSYSLSSDSKITISAQGLCEISGVPTVNLNGNSLSPVIYEQLNTILQAWLPLLQAAALAGFMPIPGSAPFIVPPLVLAPAQSQKVKLGG